MNKYVKTKEHFYINIKYLLEVNRKAYRYVVQNFYTRIQPKVLGDERFVNVQSIIKFPTFLRKQLIEDFDKKGDKLSFENGKVVLKVKNKKIMDYDSKVRKEPKEDTTVDGNKITEEKIETKEDINENMHEGISMEEIEEIEKPAEEAEKVEAVEEDESEVPEYYKSMLKKELIKIAEDNDVDLDSNDTKADIISKLNEAFGK